MKEEKKLVPKLRFPEFRGAGEWSDESLSDIATIVMGSSPKSECYNQGEIGLPLLQGNADIKNRLSAPRIFTSEITKECTVGDILLSVRAPVGSVAKSIHHACIGRGIAAVRANHPNYQEFVYQWLLSRESRWEGISQGGTFDAVNSDDLKGVAVAVPRPPEQQKIADCLSSLDELIAAQGRKVDALKTHKKGLMQQLFPIEGETQPRLRFPEFQNVGEWEGKTFSDICDIKHGYAFESEFFSNAGDFVLLTPGNFYEKGGYRDRGEQQKYFTGKIPCDYVLAKNDMLVAMTEQSAGLLGSPMLVPQSEKFLHNQRLGLVAQKPGVTWTNEFFFYVFNTESVRKAIHDTASGAKVRHTSPTKIGKVAISVPTSLPEQQCIANCLNSLDDLITTQTQELDTLKTHKKGLMQQLFPQMASEIII